MTHRSFPLHRDTSPSKRERAAVHFLESNRIPFEIFQHPAAYTCEQAMEFLPELTAAPTKHLFLTNRRGDRHFLVVVKADTTVDLKSLSVLLQTKGLTLASVEKLRELLGVDSGAVCLLGLLNDVEGKVELIVDIDLWDGPTIVSHPLVNTATIVLTTAAVSQILEVTGHVFFPLKIPKRL